MTAKRKQQAAAAKDDQAQNVQASTQSEDPPADPKVSEEPPAEDPPAEDPAPAAKGGKESKAPAKDAYYRVSGGLAGNPPAKARIDRDRR